MELWLLKANRDMKNWVLEIRSICTFSQHGSFHCHVESVMIGVVKVVHRCSRRQVHFRPEESWLLHEVLPRCTASIISYIVKSKAILLVTSCHIISIGALFYFFLSYSTATYYITYQFVYHWLFIMAVNIPMLLIFNVWNGNQEFNIDAKLTQWFVSHNNILNDRLWSHHLRPEAKDRASRWMWFWCTDESGHHLISHMTQCLDIILTTIHHLLHQLICKVKSYLIISSLSLILISPEAEAWYRCWGGHRVVAKNGCT